MPTDLRASIKQLVRLKPSESCHTMKRHCYEGVLREVAGAWEAQLRKYPNDKNFLWVDVPWTVAHAVKGPNKKAGFGSPHRINYKHAMVEKAYLLAREEGWASRPLDMEIDGVLRHGFVLTPHDALCQREQIGCRLVGPRTVPGTKWLAEMFFKDGKPTGKRSIIFQGFLLPEGGDQGRESGRDLGGDQGRDLGRESGRDLGRENAVEQGEGLGDGPAKAEVVKFVEDVPEPQPVEPAISESNCGTYPVDLPVPLVSQTRLDHPSRTTPQPAASVSFPSLLTDKTFGHGKDKKDEPTAKGEEISCDEQPTPALTVREHFSGRCDVLRVITDGELLMDNPSVKDFKQKARLIEVCEQVVKDNADLELRDRKTLAGLMGKVMDALDVYRHEVKKFQDRTLLYPKPWNGIKLRLGEGGPVKLVRPVRRTGGPSMQTSPLSAEHQSARIVAWNLHRANWPNNDLDACAEAFEKSWKP